MKFRWLILFVLPVLLIFSVLNPLVLGFSIKAKAAVLMDPVSGRVLYAQNENQRLPPASVTKVMTMLLILEAIDKNRLKWDEKILISSTAAGMGGSQVYLKEGEEFTVRDLFKTIAVVSANDASAALAEYLYGSVEDFVDAMNQRTRELGLKNTHFANETGLPDSQHYSSAYDLAVMSRELLKYPEVLKYTSIWLDSIRGGEFVLRNTNELLRTYRGADGLKTGHTAEAKFCLSATAVKGQFRLITVILGADSDKERVAQTRRLLDYGYRSYQLKIAKKANIDAGRVYVEQAQPQFIPVELKRDLGVVVERGADQFIDLKLTPSKKLKLPVKPGQNIGMIQAVVKGKTIATAPVYATVKAGKANFLVRWWRMLRNFIVGIFQRKSYAQVDELLKGVKT